MTSGSASPTRLGVMISGRGSNLVAIHRAMRSGILPEATLARVVVNHAGTQGERYCAEQQLPVTCLEASAYENRAAFDAAVRDLLLNDDVTLVALAGYDRIITPVLLEAFAGRILNIHPSLLPAYGGKNMVGLRVHQAVIEAGETLSGCTVHGVTDVVDGGPILAQARVAVEKEDTPELLAHRVLMMEHQLYPQAIAAYIRSGFNAENMRAGLAGTAPRLPPIELFATTAEEIVS
ncbi:MAG: phosphoribosylglycinamide formyltransferase [Candidatus Melainabacteria bacterium]